MFPSNELTAEQELDGSPTLFDLQFFLSILDPRPFILPMSLKRCLLWLFILLCSTGLFFAEKEYDIFTKFEEFSNENILPMMIILYAYEPLMLIIYMIFSQRLSAIDQCSELELDGMERIQCFQKNTNLAIVIPCHNSAGFIEHTVRSCLSHVSPEQIFIMDNGKTDSPTDNTKEIVHSVSPNVNYFYLPNTGNKTLAQVYATKYISEYHPTLTSVLLIDDDVLLPQNFKVRWEFFDDPKVKGIVYPLLARSPYKQKPLISRHQNIEYQMADLEMAFQDKLYSVARPHGAASLWETQTLMEILLRHNSVFKGEDILMGLVAKSLESSNRLRIDLQCHFQTLVPQSYIGTPPNLYAQRVRAWAEAQYLYPWNLLLKPLLTSWRGFSFLGLLAVKNSQIYNLYTLLMYIIHYPLMILYRNNPVYWGILLAMKGLQLLTTILFNYTKLPFHMRNDLLSVCTFPIYKEIDTLFGTLAFLRVLFISAPQNPHPGSIRKQIHQKKIRITDAFPMVAEYPTNKIIFEEQPQTDSTANKASFVQALTWLSLFSRRQAHNRNRELQHPPNSGELEHIQETIKKEISTMNINDNTVSSLNFSSV